MYYYSPVLKMTKITDNVKQLNSKKPLKVLYVRGMGGDDNSLTQEKITRCYLALLQANLEYILAPHEVEVAKLDGSAKKDRWLPILEKLPLSSYDVIVGHSSGVQAVMYLAEHHKLNNLVLTGATAGHDNLRSEIITGWFDKAWDYAAIKANTRKIIICNGKKDSLINYQEALALGKELNCRVYLFRKQGHLSEWTHHSTRDDSDIVRKNAILKEIIEEAAS